MKINALIAQFPISLSIQENLATILKMLDHAEPGDWILFPEGSLSGYALDLSFLDSLDHQELSEALNTLGVQAQERGIFLWVGACTPKGMKWRNQAFGFTPNGEIHRYQKINLAHHERAVFIPGDQLPVFSLDTPAGLVKIGVQLCREIRYPEQWGWLARQGAQVILHLNNAVGDDRYQSVWRSHLVSRAAETQRFVLSVNNAAVEQICPSIALAPDGYVLAEIVSAEAEIRRVKLDLSLVSNWYIDQSRSDVVTMAPPMI
ncbi:MAG: carbon-nitrogen hydrolase family protein [Chloroflexi bacterium]|nr:carbon-nitrogen hydrolase family protein [Chloroflexota bacterium]